MGILNNVKHTSNDLNDLKQWSGDAYMGEERYMMQPAMRDNNITANGTAPLKFAKEVMIALEVAPEKSILECYNFYKYGCYETYAPYVDLM